MSDLRRRYKARQQATMAERSRRRPLRQIPSLSHRFRRPRCPTILK